MPYTDPVSGRRTHSATLRATRSSPCVTLPRIAASVGAVGDTLIKQLSLTKRRGRCDTYADERLAHAPEEVQERVLRDARCPPPVLRRAELLHPDLRSNGCGSAAWASKPIRAPGARSATLADQRLATDAQNATPAELVRELHHGGIGSVVDRLLYADERTRRVPAKLRAAINAEIDDRTWDPKYKHDGSVRWETATSVLLTREQLRSIVYKSSDTAIVGGAALNPGCDADMLRYLSGHRDENIRGNVACNENSPLDTLEKLSIDPNDEVRGHVAQNADCPTHLLQQLSCDASEYVRADAATHRNSPTDMLEELAEDVSANVRASAAQTLRDRGARHDNDRPAL